MNLSRLGYGVHVIIGVHCDPGCIPDVMLSLQDVNQVRMVSAGSGRWDLLITASFRSKEDLFGFLSGPLGKMSGVRNAETSHGFREAKRDYYFWDTQPLVSLRFTELGGSGQETEPSGGTFGPTSLGFGI